MTLYEIDTRYRTILADMDAAEDEGEYADLLEALLQVDQNMEEKSEQYARVIKNISADIDAYAVEIKRLQAKKKAAETLKDRMRTNLLETMSVRDIKKLKTTVGTWSRSLGAASVEVVDVHEVPERFLVYSDPTVDKRAVLAEYKETGELFSGVDVVRKEKLTFR